MTEKLYELLEASIELELSMSKLYFLYANLFPEDSEFWGKLAHEETKIPEYRHFREFCSFEIWLQRYQINHPKDRQEKGIIISRLHE